MASSRKKKTPAKKALAKPKSRSKKREFDPKTVTPPPGGTGVQEPGNDGRLNLRIDPALKEWAMGYAERKSTTVTQIIVNHLTALRQQDEDLLAADAEPL